MTWSKTETYPAAERTDHRPNTEDQTAQMPVHAGSAGKMRGREGKGWDGTGREGTEGEGGECVGGRTQAAVYEVHDRC